MARSKSLCTPFAAPLTAFAPPLTISPPAMSKVADSAPVKSASARLNSPLALNCAMILSAIPPNPAPIAPPAIPPASLPIFPVPLFAPAIAPVILPAISKVFVPRICPRFLKNPSSINIALSP
ncbi:MULTISPECIES: hypothetical protein [Helicobacter]|uniref:hypothetical protein n=1 Tax=Helicobacter TaxID=209 RepID=UPI002635CED9|nr:hypothetical protein [Helicobacter sp. UBA3407]